MGKQIVPQTTDLLRFLPEKCKNLLFHFSCCSSFYFPLAKRKKSSENDCLRLQTSFQEPLATTNSAQLYSGERIGMAATTSAVQQRRERKAPTTVNKKAIELGVVQLQMFSSQHPREEMHLLLHCHAPLQKLSVHFIQ